jgi:hypothetical protein
MTIAELEFRLAALEAKVAKLGAGAPQSAEKKAAESTPADTRDRWWERIHGIFENDDAFKEAMRLGREWRTGKKTKAASRSKKTRRRAK